jgi:hypothetical protein
VRHRHGNISRQEATYIWKQFFISPEDADFLAFGQLRVEELARLCRGNIPQFVFDPIEGLLAFRADCPT